MIDDIRALMAKFGMDKDKLTKEKFEFRLSLLAEEFIELQRAVGAKSAEEVVDAHIDMIVIILGNLLLAGIDVAKAWDEVSRANLSKKRGVKPGRENSGGFDMIKPKDWKAPSHAYNHGKLDEVL